MTATAAKHPARQAGGLRRNSRAGPVIRREARRVRPGWAHRPRAPRMRPSVGPSGFLPYGCRPESAASSPACRSGGTAPGSQPAAVWAQLRARPGLLDRNDPAPSRLPTRDLRTRRLRLRVPLRIRRRSPSMARFAVHEAALARRSLTGICRKTRSTQRMRSEAKIVLLTS